MKALLTFLLVINALTSFSQRPIEEDSFPRYLIPPNANLNNYTTYISEYGNQRYTPKNRRGWPELDRFELIYKHSDPNYYNNFLFDFNTIGLFTVSFVNQCGDRYYDNGALQSRCACTTDSVRHGKSVYWDTQGRITSVSYYYKGVMTSSKSYSEGRLTEVSKYDDQGRLHGERISIYDDVKKLSHFNHGTQEGILTSYKQGKILQKSEYQNGVEISHITFNLEGDTLTARYFDLTNNYYPRIPKGTWVEYYALDQSMSYIKHSNGQPFEIHTFVNKQLREHHIILPDRTTDHFIFNEQGDTLSKFSTIGRNNVDYTFTTTPFYDQYLITTSGYYPHPISSYNVDNRKKAYVRNGYITMDSCVVHYNAAESTFNHPYLICHVTRDDDTLEQFYSINDRQPFEYLLHRNHYVKNENGYVENGNWLHFENNKLVSMATLSAGELTGPFVLYDTVSEPHPYLYGRLNNGTVESYTQVEGELRVEYHTSNNKPNEIYVFYLDADTNFIKTSKSERYPQYARKITATKTPFYREKFLNDSVVLIENYWKNDSIHWKGRLINNVLDGTLQEYNTNGVLLREGYYSKGIAARKWLVRITKKNGKIVYRKRKLEVNTPNLREVKSPFDFYDVDLLARPTPNVVF